MHPEPLAGGFVEAEDALDFRIEPVIGDEDPPRCDHRPRVAVANPGPPANLEPRGRNALEDAPLPPHAIAPRPPPLRPIVGTGGEEAEEREGEGGGGTNLWRQRHGSFAFADQASSFRYPAQQLATYSLGIHWISVFPSEYRV